MTKQVSIKNSDQFALVSDEDYDRVIVGHPLHLTEKGYVKIGGKSLHEFILGTKYIKNEDSKKWRHWRIREKYLIDHINHNRLDNRRENLRYATWSQNNANRAPKGKLKLKGVLFNEKDQRYIAYIVKDNKPIHIGTFKDAESAGRAYDAVAKELHGEFAWTNFND